MRLVSMFVLLAIVSACYGPNPEIIVRGEFVWNTPGRMSVVECETGSVYEVGVMASNRYFSVTREAQELSLDGALPVLIVLKGPLNTIGTSAGVKDSSGTIEMPDVIDLQQGDCGGSA